MRLFLVLALLLASLMLPLVVLAIILGRAFPAGISISFEQAHGGDSDIYAMMVDTRLALNLTRNPALDFGAVWSPDGTRLAFISARSLQLRLFLLTLGEGVRQLSDQTISPGFHPVWSPDAKSIVYEFDTNNRRHLSIVEVDQPLVPGTNPRILAPSQTDDRLPAWSPDGARIAFVSWREGNAEIFAVDPDGGSLTNLTRDPGWDVSPAWSPDGTRIAFFAIRDRYRELYIMDRDGNNLRQLSNAREVNNGNY